jgi:hypothetical protein
MSELIKNKRRKNMKKIILGIITIMLAAAIFGCGKTASNVGSSGGGSSGGGGGGTPNTPKTFSVRGKIDLSKTDGAAIQAWGQFEVAIYSFNADTDISNVDIKYYALDNSYAITGIPAGDVYMIKANNENEGVELSALVWGAAGENKTVNLTPISTVTVELVSANPVIQATLEAANENTDMGVIEEIQDDIAEYYSNPAALAGLTDSVNNGDLDVAALPSDVLDIVDDKVELNSRTLSVAVWPVGTGTVSPNGGVYLSGTALRLKAVASEGYEFKSWSNGENSNPWEIKLENSNISVTANFAADTGYAAPDSFTAQGSMAFNESGGISIMAVNEQIKIKVSSFKDSDKLDFVKISFTGNTYEVSNLPVDEVCVIEAVRGGRARLKSLVWGTTDGETKTADLTPTSTVIVDFLEAIDFHGEHSVDPVDLARLETIRQNIESYYADPAHEAELADLLDILNRGEEIAFDDLSDGITAPFVRQVPEIANPANWAYESSGDCGGYYMNNPKPADLEAGGLFTGVQLGQKDGKLYFMLKLNGEANPALRYQLMIGQGNENDSGIHPFNISVQEDGLNSDNSVKWKLLCHSSNQNFTVDPAGIFLKVENDLIIAGGIPLTMITGYLGTALSYDSQTGVALKNSMNYYDTNKLRVRF